MTKIPKDIQDKFAAAPADDGLTPFERAQLAILERQAAAAKPTRKPAGKQYGWRHVFGVLFVIFFVLPCVAVKMNSNHERATDGTRESVLHAALNGNAQAAPTPPAPVVKVTARQLAKECDANEVAFLATYKGKRVEVTGKVDSIGAGLLGGPSVHLRGLNMFNTILVDGVSKKFAASLSKGDTITVTCDRVDEVIGSPALSGCK